MIQDNQIETYRLRVCSSSTCWWGSRRPLLLLYRHCVPFQSPLPPWFPLSLGRMALRLPAGFPHYRSRGFLHLKVSDVAQRLLVFSLSSCQSSSNMWNCTMGFFTSEILWLGRSCPGWSDTETKDIICQHTI